jgi:hypothetical protein
MEPIQVGLAAGILHHICLQYPYQAKLLTTIKAFAFGNLAYAVWVLSTSANSWGAPGIKQTVYTFLLFTIVYVRSVCELSDRV